MEQLIQNVKTEYSSGNRSSAKVAASKFYDHLTKLSSQSVIDAWQKVWLEKDLTLVCFLLREKIDSIPSSNHNEWEFWLHQYCQLVDCIDNAWCHSNSDLLGNTTHKLSQRLITCGVAIRGLLPVMSALNKLLDCHEHNLTSLHTDLVELALHAKCIKPILPILERDVYDIENQKGYFHMKHYLLYFYHGGNAYLAVKEYKRALWFFEQCMVSKAKKLSKVTVDAYKKYILVSLLVHGRLKSPIGLANPMYQLIKDHPKLYLDFANLFSLYEPVELIEFARSNEEAFRADEMNGLVKQCIQHQRKLRIQQLGRTFVTISLFDLVTKVKLNSVSETEHLLLTMIASGSIHAKIDHSNNMVHFYDNAEDYSSVQAVEFLTKTVASCHDLQKRLQTARKSLCLHRLFQKAVLNSQENVNKVYH